MQPHNKACTTTSPSQFLTISLSISSAQWNAVWLCERLHSGWSRCCESTLEVIHQDKNSWQPPTLITFLIHSFSSPHLLLLHTSSLPLCCSNIYIAPQVSCLSETSNCMDSSSHQLSQAHTPALSTWFRRLSPQTSSYQLIQVYTLFPIDLYMGSKF